MLTSLQAQADGTGTLDGSAIEDFLSIAGYETPGGGGGGGGNEYTVRHVILNSPEIANSIQLEYIADFDNEPYRLIAVPYVNGVPYYSYEISLSAGVTDFEYGFMVFNDNDTVIQSLEAISGYTAQVSGDVTLTEEDGFWYFNIAGDGAITLTVDAI